MECIKQLNQLSLSLNALNLLKDSFDNKSVNIESYFDRVRTKVVTEFATKSLVDLRKELAIAKDIYERTRSKFVRDKTLESAQGVEPTNILGSISQTDIDNYIDQYRIKEDAPIIEDDVVDDVEDPTIGKIHLHTPVVNKSLVLPNDYVYTIPTASKVYLVKLEGDQIIEVGVLDTTRVNQEYDTSFENLEKYNVTVVKSNGSIFRSLQFRNSTNKRITADDIANGILKDVLKKKVVKVTKRGPVYKKTVDIEPFSPVNQRYSTVEELIEKINSDLPEGESIQDYKTLIPTTKDIEQYPQLRNMRGFPLVLFALDGKFDDPKTKDIHFIAFKSKPLKDNSKFSNEVRSFLTDINTLESKLQSPYTSAYFQQLIQFLSKNVTIGFALSNTSVLSRLKKLDPFFENFTDTQLNDVIDSALKVLPYYYGTSVDEEGKLKTHKKRLSSLNEFYEEVLNDYSPEQFEKFINTQREKISNMFQGFGVKLSDQEVTSILNTPDLLSGNVIATLSRGSLGLNESITNELFDKKKPKDDMVIVVNGKTVKYKDLKDAFNAVREEISEIAIPTINSVYRWNYSGTESEKAAAVRRGSKVVRATKTKGAAFDYTFRLNKNTVSVVNTVSNSEEFLQTNGLAAGKGTLSNQINSFSIAQKNVGDRNSMISSLFHIVGESVDQTKVVPKSLFPNKYNIQRSFDKHLYNSLRTSLNILFEANPNEIQNFQLYVLSNIGEDFPKNNIINKKRGTLSQNFELNDSALFEITKNYFEENDLFKNPLLRDIMNAALTTANVSIKEDEDINYSALFFNIQETLLEEGINNAYIGKDVFEYFVNPDNYENGEWKRDPQKPATFPRENVAKSDWENEDKTIVDNTFNQVYTTYDGFNEPNIIIDNTEQSKQKVQENKVVTENPVVVTAVDDTSLADEFDDLLGDNAIGSSMPINENTVLDIQQALLYAQQILPEFTSDELVFLTRQAFNNKFNEDWNGAYKEGFLYFASDGTVGKKLLRHEIFHKIFNEYLTEEERQILKRDFANRFFSNNFDLEMKDFEEALAIAYQEHRQNPENTPTGIRGIIQKIVNFFNKLFGRTDELEDFFDKVDRGEFNVRRSEPSENLVRASSRLVDLAGGVEKYNQVISDIRTIFKDVCIDGVKVLKESELLYKLPIEEVPIRVKAYLVSKLKIAKELNNSDEQKRLQKIAKEIDSFIKEALGQDLNIKSIKVVQDNSIDPEDAVGDDQNGNDATIEREVKENDEIKVFDIASENVKLFLSNLYNQDKKIPMNVGFAVSYQLFNGIKPGDTESILSQLENNLYKLGSSSDNNAVYESIKTLLDSTFVNPDLNQFPFKFLDKDTIAYVIDESNRALLDQSSYLISPSQEGIFLIKKTAEDKTYGAFIARAYNELHAAFGPTRNFTKSTRSGITFVTNLGDELQYKSNSIFNEATAASVISFFSSLRERSIYVPEERSMFNTKYQKLQNRSRSNTIAVEKANVKNIVSSRIESKLNDPNFFLALKDLLNSSLSNDLKIQNAIKLLNLGNVYQIDIAKFSNEANDFLKDLRDALFLNDANPRDKIIDYLNGKTRVLKPITKSKSSQSDETDSLEEDPANNETRFRSVDDLLNETKMDFVIEYITKIRSVSQPLKLNTSVRSLDGEKTESKMVRNTTGFTNIDTLRNLNNLSGDLLFFDTAHFKINPFVKNSGRYRGIIDIPGKKNIYQNGKERVVDTIQLKYGDTQQFNFLYLFLQTSMQYDKRSLKEGYYVQRLHQQGDSKKPKGVEVKILDNAEIEESIGAIIDQYVKLPDEIAEIKWKKKGIRSFMYLEDAAKELNVDISSSNRKKLINKVIEIIERESATEFKLAFENIQNKRPDLPANLLAIAEKFLNFGFITRAEYTALEKEIRAWVQSAETAQVLSGGIPEDLSKSAPSSKTISRDENGRPIKKEFLFDLPVTKSILQKLFTVYSKNYAVNSHHLIEIAMGSPASLFKDNESIMKRLDSVFSPGSIGAIRGTTNGTNYARESVLMGIINDPTIEVTFREGIANSNIDKNFEKVITTDFIESYITNNLSDKFTQGKLSNEEKTLLKSVGMELIGSRKITNEQLALVVEAIDFSINNRLSDRFWLKSLDLSDEDVAALLKNRGKDGYNPSDGQGFHLSRRHKELVKSYGDPSIKSVKKPLYVGTEIINGVAVPRIIKYSSVELTDELCAKYPKLAQMRDNMLHLNMDEVVMNSGIKSNSVANPFGATELFDDLTGTDPTTFTQNRTIRMYSNKYKLQLNPYSESTTVRDLSQIKYFFNDQVKTSFAGEKIYSANAALLRERRERYFEEHLLNPDGTINYKKLGKSIDQGILAKEDIKGFDRPVYIYDKLKRNSRITTPWNIPIIREDAERGILNHAHNAVKKVSFPGKKAVLQSTFGIVNYNGPVTESELEYKLHKNVVVAGNIRKSFFAADAVVPKEYIPSDVREQFLKELQEWKDGKRKNRPELFIGFGIRIPTTGAHSAMALRVVDVYDDEGTNVVIVPQQIVQIAGSDYDVDSLFMIRYNYTGYSVPDNVTFENGESIEFQTKVKENTIVGQTYNEASDTAYGLSFKYNPDTKRIESGFLKNLYNDINAINSTLLQGELTSDEKKELISIKKNLQKMLDQYYQNVMVDTYLNEFGNKDSVRLMTDIINMDKVKSWLKDKGYTGINVNPTSTRGAYIQTAAATAGIYGTGISANMTKLFAYLIKAGENGNPAILKKDGPAISTGTYKVGVPFMVREGMKMPIVFDQIEVNSKSREEIFFDLEALVNLCIDNIKELQLMGLNLNDTSIWWYATLRTLGVDFDTLNKIFLSPVMKYITSYSDYNFTQMKLQSIIDLEKAIQDKGGKVVDITDKLNSYKYTNTIPLFEELIKDDEIDTTASVLQLIASAAYIVNGSKQTPGLRKLIPIIDAIRIKQNTYSEVQNLFEAEKNIFKSDGSINFVFEIPNFFDSLPHIKEALDNNREMKQVIERTVMVRHPNVRRLYGPGTTIDKLTLSFDSTEDSKIKSNEAERFLISQVVGNKNYPSLQINNNIYSGNDAFSRLLIERHKALSSYVYSIINAKPREFEKIVRNLKFEYNGSVVEVLATNKVEGILDTVEIRYPDESTEIINKEQYDQNIESMNLPNLDNNIFLNYVESEYDPTQGVSKLTFENSYLEGNPAGSKEVENDFAKLSHFKEYFDVYTMIGGEKVLTNTVESIEDLQFFDPNYITSAEEEQAYYIVKPRYEYVGPTTGVDYTTLQRDYLDYAALNEGLKATIDSIGSILPYNLHLEFGSKYMQMMHTLIKRSGIPFTNSLSDMFNVYVAVNYNSELGMRSVNPIKTNHPEIVRQIVSRSGKTEVVTYQPLAGYDESRNIYYDLKTVIPNYDIDKFDPSTLPLSVKHNGQIFYRVDYNLDSGMIYYAKLGKASSYNIYNAITNFSDKYNIFAFIDTYKLNKLGKDDLIQIGNKLNLTLDRDLEIFEMQERIIVENLKRDISINNMDFLLRTAERLNMRADIDTENLAEARLQLIEKLDNAEYDAISPLSILMDRRIPHIKVSSLQNRSVNLLYNPHVQKAFEGKDKILVYASEPSDIFEINAVPIVLTPTEINGVYEINSSEEEVRKLSDHYSDPGSNMFGIIEGQVDISADGRVIITNENFDPTKDNCIF